MASTVEVSENVDEKSPKKIKLEAQVNDDLNEKISKQLDYYFSDVNVIKDKFLQEEFKKDDGWIKLEVLMTFSRLQQLTKDINQVGIALKDSKSDIVEFDEGKGQVRRRKPLPDVEEYKKDLDNRTVHIAGFPTDYNFEDLRRFCVQFGPVESVAMRRHFKTRFFKGCIHVVFKEKADAKKVIETPDLKCKDRDLMVESMEGYYKRKAEKAERLKEKKKNKK